MDMDVTHSFSRRLELTSGRLDATKDALLSQVQNLYIILPYHGLGIYCRFPLKSECAAIFQWLILKKDLKELVMIVRPTPKTGIHYACVNRHPMDYLFSCTASWTESTSLYRKAVIFAELFHDNSARAQISYLCNTLKLRREVMGAGQLFHDIVVCIPDTCTQEMPATITDWFALQPAALPLAWLYRVLREGHGYNSFRFAFYDSNQLIRRMGYPPKVGFIAPVPRIILIQRAEVSLLLRQYPPEIHQQLLCSESLSQD